MEASLTFKTKGNTVQMRIKKNNKTFSDSIEIINGKVSLGNLLSRLEKLTDDCKCIEIRIKKSDEIFKWLTINQLKENGQKFL